MKNIFMANRISERKSFRLKKLPFIVIFVVISTIVACSFGNIKVFGFALRGHIWVIQFVLATLLLARSMSRISFPLYLWSPWGCLILTYLAFSPYENALQRSTMLLCPIIVGITVSRYSIREAELKQFSKLCEYLTVTFLGIIAFKSGIFLSGTLPEITGLAAESMTGTLLATLFAVRYVYEERRALFYWAGLSLIPIIALTRTAIVATGLTIPTTFAPLNFRKRIIILSIVATIGIGVFYTERFQRKMFYSGEGGLVDMSLSNPDLKTAGRLWLWEIMKEQISLRPWLGYGANANESFIISVVGFQGQPHNDWMRLRFDYGYVGTFIFGLCMLFQMLHAWKNARKTNGETRILFYAGASSFIPFVLFMLTDNIILYCQFFGNLQFTILGLAYASLKTSERDAAWMRYQTYYSAIAKQQNLSSKK
jgi:O-antigen ligase